MEPAFNRLVISPEVESPAFTAVAPNLGGAGAWEGRGISMERSAQDGATGGGLCSEGTRETRLESTGQGCCFICFLMWNVMLKNPENF